MRKLRQVGSSACKNRRPSELGCKVSAAWEIESWGDGVWGSLNMKPRGSIYTTSECVLGFWGFYESGMFRARRVSDRLCATATAGFNRDGVGTCLYKVTSIG